jgi:hypothetical protein
VKLQKEHITIEKPEAELSKVVYKYSHPTVLNESEG